MNTAKVLWPFVKFPGTEESGLGKKREKIALCARCDFQRGDRVSIPKVKDGVNSKILNPPTTA